MPDDWLSYARSRTRTATTPGPTARGVIGALAAYILLLAVLLGVAALALVWILRHVVWA